MAGAGSGPNRQYTPDELAGIHERVRRLGAKVCGIERREGEKGRDSIQLDSDGKIPMELLPPYPDVSLYQLLSEKGANNGYAPLDAGGIVPLVHLPTFPNAADYQLLSQKGNPNGYAPLDGTGKVPLANLPPFPNAALYQELSEKGDPDGYCPLDSTGKVPLIHLPSGFGSTGSFWTIGDSTMANYYVDSSVPAAAAINLGIAARPAGANVHILPGTYDISDASIVIDRYGPPMVLAYGAIFENPGNRAGVSFSLYQNGTPRAWYGGEFRSIGATAAAMYLYTYFASSTPLPPSADRFDVMQFTIKDVQVCGGNRAGQGGHTYGIQQRAGSASTSYRAWVLNLENCNFYVTGHAIEAEGLDTLNVTNCVLNASGRGILYKRDRTYNVGATINVAQTNIIADSAFYDSSYSAYKVSFTDCELETLGTSTDSTIVTSAVDTSISGCEITGAAHGVQVWSLNSFDKAVGIVNSRITGGTGGVFWSEGDIAVTNSTITATTGSAFTLDAGSGPIGGDLTMSACTVTGNSFLDMYASAGKSRQISVVGSHINTDTASPWVQTQTGFSADSFVDLTGCKVRTPNNASDPGALVNLFNTRII